MQQRAGRLLNEFEAFVSECRRGESGAASDVLRIGTFEIFSTHVMGWIIEHFLAKRTVLLYEVGPAELESALLKREIDIGMTSIPVPNETLGFHKVATQELAIFGKSAIFGATAFADMPFCVPISLVSGAALPVQDGAGFTSCVRISASASVESRGASVRM